MEDDDDQPLQLAGDAMAYLQELLAARGKEPESNAAGDVNQLAAIFTSIREDDVAADTAGAWLTSQDDQGNPAEEADAPVLPSDGLVVWVTADDEYVKSRLLRSLSCRPDWSVIDEPFSEGCRRPAVHLHWGEYEHIDWEGLAVQRGLQWVSCYYNRKGLIRKALFTHNVQRWGAKHPHSPLASSMPPTLVLSPEMLRDPSALAVSTAHCFATHHVWILKPSMLNQAQGITIVSNEQDLQDAVTSASDLERLSGYVLQQYIENPLLVSGRKFHLRVYVLVLGSIKVYVYPEFLALFALQEYNTDSFSDLKCHLTNTCFQGNHDGVLAPEVEGQAVRLFSELQPEFSAGGHADVLQAMDRVRDDICQIVGECLQCVSSELTFMTRPNCFELFGFDFLVDASWKVWLLEANAEPDFKQTGQRLQSLVDVVLEDSLALILAAFHAAHRVESEAAVSEDVETRFVKVYEREPRPW